MALVHIDLMEGRSEDTIQDMVTAVSEAIASSLGSPIASIRVIVNDMKPHPYGVGGKPWPVVVEERRKEGEGKT